VHVSRGRAATASPGLLGSGSGSGSISISVAQVSAKVGGLGAMPVFGQFFSRKYRFFGAISRAFFGFSVRFCHSNRRFQSFLGLLGCRQPLRVPCTPGWPGLKTVHTAVCDRHSALRQADADATPPRDDGDGDGLCVASDPNAKLRYSARAKTYNAKEPLAVRDAPSPGGAVLGTIATGSKLVITGRDGKVKDAGCKDGVACANYWLKTTVAGTGADGFVRELINGKLAITAQGASGKVQRRHGRAMCEDWHRRTGVLLSDATVAAGALGTACWGSDAKLQLVTAGQQAGEQTDLTVKTAAFSLRVDLTTRQKYSGRLTYGTDGAVDVFEPVGHQLHDTVQVRLAADC
jgi:hypothetical protein